MGGKLETDGIWERHVENRVKSCTTHSREVKPPTHMSGKHVVLFLDMRESQRYQFAFGGFKWKNVGEIISELNLCGRSFDTIKQGPKASNTLQDRKY